MGKNGKRIDAPNVNSFVVGVNRPSKAKASKPDTEETEATPVVEVEPEKVDPKPVKATAKKA